MSNSVHNMQNYSGNGGDNGAAHPRVIPDADIGNANRSAVPPASVVGVQPPPPMSGSMPARPPLHPSVIHAQMMPRYAMTHAPQGHAPHMFGYANTYIFIF